MMMMMRYDEMKKREEKRRVNKEEVCKVTVSRQIHWHRSEVNCTNNR
jgi:hypothetical protein